MMALAMDGAASRASRPPEIDPAVVVRCRTGDPVALRAFVVRYERPVYSLLVRLVGRGPHVEDLAQETFLRAFRAFGSFDGARPSSWLFTIATRVALDARKRRTLPISELDAATSAAPAASSPEARMSRAELGRAIEQAAAALSPDQRAAFVLAEYQEMSLGEIAEALGVPEATVKTRLFRARQHMREQLAGLLEEGRHE
jgi:RNA polymerase sigma-70 factor (ECF subfamily)